MHLYIHMPFCRRRCAYCDFVSYAGREQDIAVYVDAVCAEMALLPTPRYASAGIRPSVYLGGGTPGLLSLAQVAQLVRAAGALVPLSDAEVTLEANPGALFGSGAGVAALDYFGGLRAAGVNRLSLGVQSLHDATLRVLERLHTADAAARCVATARRAGFDSLSVDMMFGLPGQTVRQWEQDLAAVVAWAPDHLSLYSLILEEQTPLYGRVVCGEVARPDEDSAATMYEAAMHTLAAAGYQQYEISNWARGGQRGDRRCHHNLAYWLNDDYLGVGAAAHGHVYPRRYANEPTLDGYLGAVRGGRRPIAEEIPLSPDDLYAETMFMGLRLNDGVRFDHFRARCGVAMEAVYAGVLDRLSAAGLLLRDAAGVRLSPRGRLLGNRVFEQFVGDIA
jgi:oxygen-independent coproporphyrinogen III oxidase